MKRVLGGGGPETRGAVCKSPCLLDTGPARKPVDTDRNQMCKATGATSGFDISGRTGTCGGFEISWSPPGRCNLHFMLSPAFKRFARDETTSVHESELKIASS